MFFSSRGLGSVHSCLDWCTSQAAKEKKKKEAIPEASCAQHFLSNDLFLCVVVSVVEKKK